MRFAFLMTFGLISGCSILSSSYYVTYDSNPQSAMVVCNNQQRGYTPLTVEYPIEAARDGSMRLEKCTAIWSSGAKDTYPTVVNTAQYPKGIRAVAVRPKGRKGLTTDLQFDQREKQNRTTNSIQRQRAWNEYSYQQESLRRQSQPVQTVCNRMGNSIYCQSN